MATKTRVRGKRVIGHDKDRKPIYKWFEADSKRALNKMINAWEDNKDKPVPLYFGEQAGKWLTSMENAIEARTYREYEIVINRLKEEYNDTEIHDISKDDFQNYLDSCYKSGLAKSTIKHRRDIMRAVCDYSIGINNPIHETKVPKAAPKKKVHAASQADIEIINNSISNPFGLFAYLLAYTGVRQSEALALTRKDFDFENKKILINKRISYTSEQPTLLQGLKNDDDERAEIMLDCLSDVLQAAFKRKDFDNIIFPSKDGKDKYMRKSEVRHAWEHYTKQTGVNAHMHQLRHSFATLCNSADVGVKTAQILLGHKDSRVTLDIYTDIENEQLEEARQLLNQKISEKGKSNEEKNDD